MKRLIMKFGGASVATPKQFDLIADIAIARKQDFSSIVIVVSAMANTTDMLVNLAKEVNPSPPSREYDMLVSVGERISIALLAMALAKKGHHAISFTGSQSGIVTSPEHSNACIVDVRPTRITQALNEGKIAIVAGFQGCSRKGEITTLGRNGSDISAVALGVALEADHVEFFKDVNGIYVEDPHVNPQSTKFQSLRYNEAIAIMENGAKVLHPRCIKLAWKNALPLRICSFLAPSEEGTWIADASLQRSPVHQYEEDHLEALLPVL